MASNPEHHLAHFCQLPFRYVVFCQVKCSRASPCLLCLACLPTKPSAFLGVGLNGGGKQEANKRNPDIVSFDGRTFLWLEQIELTFFWCAFWLINSSGASYVELFKCFAFWIVHGWSEQGHFVGRMVS